MRTTPLALALLIASPVFAQETPAQSGVETTSPAIIPAQPTPQNVPRIVRKGVLRMRAQMQAELDACPVGFSVERKSNPSLQVTKDPGAALRQGLDVNLRTNEHKVVEADIAVHGMVFRLRIVGASVNDAEDAPEEFILKGTSDEPLQLSSVRLQRLGTVSWVELTRVVFSDGTTWAPVGEARCTATPSMMVLVNTSTQSR